MLIAAEGLPRGGRLTLATEGAAIALTAIGEGDGLLPETREALAPDVPIAALTSRSIGAYFAGLLAQNLGCRLVLTSEPGRFRIGCDADAAPVG